MLVARTFAVDETQALARSEGPEGHNVGEEAALVAVEMARLAAAVGGAR